MTAKPQVDPIDDLNQIRDELLVVWLALRSSEDVEAYRVEIGEHVNGLANRLDDVSKRISPEAQVEESRP